MMQTLFLLAAALSLVFPLGWLGGPGEALAAPSISISPDDYNAGDLTRAPAMVSKTFRVSNTGDALLSITRIKYT
jgi:hypothetical protein